MKKKDIDTIFEKDIKRRHNIIYYSCIMAIFFLLACFLLYVFYLNNQTKYVKYDEKGNIDYKVFLQENEFFDGEYLTKDKQYISSLIDYIDANFNYKLSLSDDNVHYKYSYKIDADVRVVDKKNKKVLFTKNEMLLDEKQLDSSEKSLSINENVKIDYNKFNNLIKKFVSVYDVKDSDSVLNINMKIMVKSDCDDVKDSSSGNSVLTLSIPLTQKTMAVDIKNDLINTKNNLMICSRPSIFNYIFVILSLASFVIFGVVGYKLSNYIKDTRTAKNIYDIELKKILRSYGPYIQKVDGAFSLRGYQCIKIDVFTDLLEIRDTIEQPILMVENAKQDGVFFIIPSNTKLLYTYSIKVSEISKDLKKGK